VTAGKLQVDVGINIAPFVETHVARARWSSELATGDRYETMQYRGVQAGGEDIGAAVAMPRAIPKAGPLPDVAVPPCVQRARRTEIIRKQDSGRLNGDAIERQAATGGGTTSFIEALAKAVNTALVSIRPIGHREAGFLLAARIGAV